jgi:hypothetical protein
MGLIYGSVPARRGFGAADAMLDVFNSLTTCADLCVSNGVLLERTSAKRPRVALSQLQRVVNLPRQREEPPLVRRQRHLGVKINAILTPPRVFCMDNH